MSHKHFCLRGSVLVQFLMSEQAASLLCWLHLEAPRTSMEGLQVFAKIPFLYQWESHKTSADCRETRNSISKEITQNSSHTISFLSRNDFYEGIIAFLLSLHCILCGLYGTSPVKDLICFLSRLLLSNFSSSFQFSWDSTCYSKRSIKIQLWKKKISAS